MERGTGIRGFEKRVMPFNSSLFVFVALRLLDYVIARAIYGVTREKTWYLF